MSVFAKTRQVGKYKNGKVENQAKQAGGQAEPIGRKAVLEQEGQFCPTKVAGKQDAKQGCGKNGIERVILLHSSPHQQSGQDRNYHVHGKAVIAGRVAQEVRTGFVERANFVKKFYAAEIAGKQNSCYAKPEDNFFYRFDD